MIPDKSNIFIPIIDNHKGIIYKIVDLYCRDELDRKDLTQEIILQLWKSFDSYNEEFKHSTWIYRIALNVSISFYRKERTRKKILAPFSEDIFNKTDTQKNPDVDMKRILLQQFLSELKELDKALMLLYFEEKSHKEIAEIIGISQTNVATKISRIKILLKQKFLQTKLY